MNQGTISLRVESPDVDSQRFGLELTDLIQKWKAADDKGRRKLMRALAAVNRVDYSGAK